jgi:type IX secretion system PorP/SprF family membrane protein
MHRLLLIFALIICHGIAHSQQDPHYSQFMNNIMNINPGYAGSKDLICLAGTQRMDYVGLKGAPRTSAVSINSPVHFFKNSSSEKLKNFTSGLGLTFLNETWGFDKNLGLSLAYAYIINIKKGATGEKIGSLGIGLNGGFLNKSLDVKDGWVGMDGPGTDDAAIPLAKTSSMGFDMGAGIFYRSETMNFGLSTTHLNKTKVKYEKAQSSLARHYYLTAGYNLTLPNPMFEFQPSIFIGSDGSSSVYDLNTVIQYNKRIWGGVSYRVSSAIVGMVGFELLGGLRIGYSYDFATTSLSGYSKGSHEVTLGYNFNIITEKIPRKYKSVRFL